MFRLFSMINLSGLFFGGSYEGIRNKNYLIKLIFKYCIVMLNCPNSGKKNFYLDKAFPK